MPNGILIFGANGSGKSTLARELARELRFHSMDIEEYYFQTSDVPYTVKRSREEYLNRMQKDIESYGPFVLCAVTGDFGEELQRMFRFAVYVSAPLETRLRRIRQRALLQHGQRVQEGGDMYEQQQRFVDFVAKRSLRAIEQWIQILPCPVLRVDGTRPVSENVKLIQENLSLDRKVFTQS